MSNLGLVSYNKKFPYCAVRGPGSTHDARMLRNSAIYQKIVTGHAIYDRATDLGEHGKIPLVTVGDSFSEARLVDKGFPRRYVRQKGEVI